MTDRSPKQIGFTDLNMSPRALRIVERPDGSTLLRSGHDLPDYPVQLSDILRARAADHPHRNFLAERDASGGDWRCVTYGEMCERANAISQWLLDNGHGADNPICILSDNSIAFASLMLGAMQVGIPVMPVSPAYSLMSTDYAKIRFIFETFTPSLVYAETLGPFAKALSTVDLASVQVVARHHAGEIPGTFTFDELTATAPGPAVEEAYRAVTPDSVGKVLLTSGSTGLPKGVINPQRMLTSNTLQVSRLWRFLGDRPPVVVDWLPWNHTFGANFCFNTILAHGGTMYIDSGKPIPGRFEESLRNLREVRPTILWNVARAYDLLVAELEKDDDFNTHVFGDLDMAFYAGAGLPQAIWDKLEVMSIRARGSRTPLLTSLGSTETGPSAICCHWTSDVTGSIGHPVPGLDAKLVPVDGKSELRVRGPNITPGYYRDPAKTAEAFDDEGFFKIGDAVKWADPDDPDRGLMFDGRVAENFKLLTGTWVAVGNLRLAALSGTAPLLQDAAVCGEGREEIGLLAFPNLPAMKSLIGEAADGMGPDEIVADDRVHRALAEKLRAYNAGNPGSSTKVARVLLMTEPPSIDAGEITDKGYLNQRAVLTRRAALVERLYDEERERENADILVVSHWH